MCIVRRVLRNSLLFIIINNLFVHDNVSLPSTARCSLYSYNIPLFTIGVSLQLILTGSLFLEVGSAVMGGLGNHRNRIWIFTWHWPEWLARSVDFCPPTVVQTIFANASASMYNLYLWSSLKTSASMYLNTPSDTPGEYHSKKFGSLSLDKNRCSGAFFNSRMRWTKEMSSSASFSGHPSDNPESLG